MLTEERRQSVLRREFAASEQKAAGDAQRHAASSVGAFESAREHEEEHSRITAAVEAIRGEGRAATATPADKSSIADSTVIPIFTMIMIIAYLI